MQNTQATKLLYEQSKPGRRGVRLPECDVPWRPIDELLPRRAVAAGPIAVAEKLAPFLPTPVVVKDYSFHAPTVYFPLIVREALMIEPTETESKATLDAFAEALQRIIEEDADTLHKAPHGTPISRADEVQAAREPVLRWTCHE